MKTMTKPVEKTWVDTHGVDGDPGFSNSYDFDIYDGKLLDKQGSKDLTLNGYAAWYGQITRHKDPVFGTKARFNGRQYASVAAHPVMASTTQTFEFTIFSESPLAPSLQGLITNGSTGADTQRLVVGSNRINYSYYVGAAFVSVGTTLGPVLSTNPQIYHVIVTREYTGGNTIGTIYINGNLVQTNTTAGAPIVTNSNCYLGYLNSNRLFQGNFYGPVNMYTVAKDADWVQARYLRVAKAVQFRTEDGIKVSTDGGQTGGYVGGNAPFRVNSGEASITMSTGLNGEALKVLKLHLSGTRITLDKYLGSSLYGTWTFWVNLETTSSHAIIYLLDDSRGATNPASGNGYRLYLMGSTRVYFSRITAAVPTTLMESTTGGNPPSVWVKWTITRRYDGQIALYRNNVLLPVTIGTNPITDATYKDLDIATLASALSPVRFAVSGRADGRLTDEYSITKRFGVVAP